MLYQRDSYVASAGVVVFSNRATIRLICFYYGTLCYP